MRKSVWLILCLIAGCASSFTVPIKSKSVWLHKPEGSQDALLLLRGEHEAFILNEIYQCNWVRARNNTPQSTYQFELIGNGNSSMSFELLGNSFFFVTNGYHVYTCQLSSSAADTIRAIYQDPYTPYSGA